MLDDKETTAAFREEGDIVEKTFREAFGDESVKKKRFKTVAMVVFALAILTFYVYTLTGNL